MLVGILKWTQLIVAIAATILAALIWPGIMVVIPVAIGVIYIAAAAGAIRERRVSVWLACLLSIGVALLSSSAVSENDLKAWREYSAMDDVPVGAISPTGELVPLDSIPDAARAELSRIHAEAASRRRLISGLLVLVWLGSCAVVLLHAIAWRWVLHGNSRIGN